MGKSLKSLMQIFATYASAIFVGKESCKSTVRYALWSRISLIKPLQNPYLTLTRFRLSLLSRSRSACAPRTPSLFKDKSQLSFPSLASLICLCMLTVGVGNALGASVSMSTTVKIFPNGSTTVANGAWISACSASQGYWTGDKTFSTPGGSLNFNGKAGDNNNAYKCQLKAAEGVITTTITSSYGVDVEVSSKIKESGGEITISITTSGDPDTQTCTATDFTSKTVSTTSTSATLTISNTGSKVGGVQYIKITPKTASTKTFTLMLPKGDGTYDEYETTDADDLADPDVASLGADCGGEDLNGYFAYKWTTSAIARASASTYDLSDISPKYDDDNPPSTSATLYPLFYDGESGLLHTAPVCVVPCANSVSIAKGTESNCEISFSSASVSTCTGTRQVTVSVTPSTCYAAPAKESVTSTGTTATWVSGPTQNGSAYDYVYGFAENATGTATFSCSLTTKTTYTVSYAAGNTTCTGGNAITGSKANDTKTCGADLTLPGETFYTTGYTQTGWAKSSCGSQTNGLGGSYTSDAAQTFYPVWSINSYSVTWKVNNTNYSAGGSSSVNHGSHISTLPTAPNPPTYGCGDVFVGWTDVQNYVHGTSPLYTTAAEFPNATGDQVFYAVYADYTTD